MPQSTTLGIWRDMVDEKDYATYSETNAIDIITTAKDLESKQYDFDKNKEPKILTKYIEM